MYIAYIISAYKHPLQLARLVHKLNSNLVCFFIHVDQRTDLKTFNQMKHLLEKFSNVYFLDRHDCYWGDFGHVNATIKGIKAVDRTCVNYDYVILLTGQCYPIKSNEAIFDFFKKNKGMSYMTHYPPGKDRMKRIERWHFHLFSRTYFFFSK